MGFTIDDITNYFTEKLIEVGIPANNVYINDYDFDNKEKYYYNIPSANVLLQDTRYTMISKQEHRKGAMYGKLKKVECLSEFAIVLFTQAKTHENELYTDKIVQDFLLSLDFEITLGTDEDEILHSRIVEFGLFVDNRHNADVIYTNKRDIIEVLISIQSRYYLYI